MKVKIDKSRKVYKGSLNSGRINENKYEVLEFEFPQELENFTKYIEIEATDSEGTLRYADRIEDNEFAIDNTLSKYSLITAQVICKDLRENVVFKSNPFEFTFEQSLNIMEDIEEEQHDLLDRIELELQEAKEDITELQETQAEHTEQIQTNATDIATLQGQVATNETDIANIKTKNIQQDTAIGANTQDISDIKAEQTTQNTNITSNTNRITVLEHDSGNKVALSIDSNYVMTLQLLNKNNEVLSTGTIDLPIESMIVNASYSNGVLTLTLQNGQTLNVDISDIVSGLVSETTFNNAIGQLQGSITVLQGRMTQAETALQGKVDKVQGKGLSTEDYTTAEKNKLANLENYDDTEVKESIADLEAKHDTEVAELNQKIADLQEEVDMASDLIPTGDASGSDITLSDSARYYFKKIVPGGKSEQETYKGTNVLIPLYEEGYTSTKNGVTATIQENGEVKLAGTATNNISFELYKINLEENKSYYANIFNSLYGSSNVYLQMNGSDYTFYKNFFNSTSPYNSTVNDANAKVFVYIPNGVTINTVIKPMIQIGSEATEYEKYVGGQPAPNPNYECPIQNVTGDVEVKVENKNLIPITNQEFTINGVTFKAINGKIILNGTASANITGDKFVNDNYFKIDFQSRSYVLSRTNVNSDLGIFLMSENKQQMLALGRTEQILSKDITINVSKMGYIGFFIPSGATFNNYDGGIMFSENGGDYQPHEEQTVTFPLSEGQVLHKDDVISDKIVQRRKTRVLNGTENWYGYKGADSQYSYRVFGLANIQGLATNSNILSNYFINNKSIITNANGNAIACISSNTLYISIDKSLIADTSPEAFKTYLANLYANGTPVILEYELAEPIETEFTEAQATAKAQIDKLYSYKGTTHITSEADLDVTYRKDLETIIDNLSNAIVAQGGI